MGPLALAGISLGAKALGKVFGHKGEQSKGKEQLRAAKAQHGVDETTRQARNNAAQAMLSKLFGGRYAMDPAAFSSLNATRAFTGADPTKGSTWGLIGQGLSGLGDLAGTAAMNKSGDMGGMGAPMSMADQTGIMDFPTEPMTSTMDTGPAAPDQTDLRSLLLSR